MKSAEAVLLILCLPLLPLAAQATLPGASQAPGSPTAAGSTTAPPAAAQPGTGKPDLSVPVDKKDTWVVGFCALNAERVPAEDQYLTYSIPLMLKNQLAGISVHSLPEADRDRMRHALIAHELTTVDQNVTALYKERDALLLNTIDATIPPTSAVDAKITLALARRDFLRSMDPTLIKVVEQKPLSVKEGSGVGKLFDALSIPASVFCERQGIDLLVGGMVRDVEGYVLLDVWAYDAASNSVVVSYRDAARRDEVYQSVPPAGRQLTGLFLGKPWASISFTPDPPGGSLFVGGKLVATGRTPLLYVTPGTLDIKVSAPGYRDVTQTMSIGDAEEAALSVTLEKEKTGAVVISSTPSGADVYVESVWKGKTPLSLETPFDRTRVDITAQGFYDMPFSVSESSPSELSFVLQPDSVSRDAVQKKARNDFYDAFTWFALSLPVPLFCYAFALDSAVQARELGSGPQYTSAQVRGTLFYGGYLVGTVVSASLFTWMLFRIIHYVTVSTRTAG